MIQFTLVLVQEEVHSSEPHNHTRASRRRCDQTLRTQHCSLVTFGRNLLSIAALASTHVAVRSGLSLACHRTTFSRQYFTSSRPVMTQLTTPINLDEVLREIRNSLVLHPARSGAVKIVIELETGEQLTVLEIDARCPRSAKPTLPLRHCPVPRAEAATSSVRLRGDDGPVDDHSDNWVQVRQHTEQGLLQRCNQQQQRIAELEQRLQQVQLELHQHARSSSASPAAPSVDRGPPSPASSTDDDSSSVSSTSDSPHRSSGGDTDEDGHGPHNDTVPMTDDADDAAFSSPCQPASNDSTAVRRSERSKTNVERWSPPPQQDVPRRIAEPASSHKKRRTKRRQRSHHDDGERSMCSDTESMQVDSVDSHDGDDGADDDDAVEVAALVVKLREGFDKRQTVALDSLSKESIVSLRQQVLDEAGDRAACISSQITSLITTSTSLKMVGYYLRAMLAHRLKFTSQNCYKRLARDTLGVKSPADIAAYPALYDLVLYHYPTLASAGLEAWLENLIFMADITWTEWKRYLTKAGRPLIDAALQQFKASVAPFQDWMQLGWVEIYEDDKHGQGVRALRDIRMPVSKAKEAQRDVAASISVVAADLHCAGQEFVKVKDPTLEVDPEYLIQLDQQRVFDARHHWVGKINHLPMPRCNLKVTGNGKLVQIKPIQAGEALALDYSVDYWVYQVTGLATSEWLSDGNSVCQRGRMDLFTRMHESVLDYSKLLQAKWARSLSSTSSALDREALLVDLEDYLDAYHCVA